MNRVMLTKITRANDSQGSFSFVCKYPRGEPDVIVMRLGLNAIPFNYTEIYPFGMDRASFKFSDQEWFIIGIILGI